VNVTNFNLLFGGSQCPLHFELRREFHRIDVHHSSFGVRFNVKVVQHVRRAERLTRAADLILRKHDLEAPRGGRDAAWSCENEGVLDASPCVLAIASSAMVWRQFRGG